MLCLGLALLAAAASTSSGSARRGSSSTSARAEAPAECADGFKQALSAVESYEALERVKPALAGLSFACPAVLTDLGEAASKAKELERPERAAALAQAASLALPPACSTTAPLSPAATVVWSCPPQDKLELAEQLLQDLDAGTYLFMLAVRARLANADALDESAKKLLDNLVMAAALEGEQAALNGTAAAAAPPL